MSTQPTSRQGWTTPAVACDVAAVADVRGAGPGRLASIDTLRALAIAGVVVFHADAHLDARIPILHASGGLLGVQLFFLVSGYLISASAREHRLGAYVLHRLFRIYPAYWTALLAVTALRHHWPATADDLPWFALTYLGLSHLNAYALLRYDVLGISWTLTVELAWYALAPLLVWAAGRREPAWGLLLVPFAALSTLWVWTADRGWLDWWVGGFDRLGLLPLAPMVRFVFVTNQFPAHLALFILGAAIRTHETRLARWPTPLLVAGLILLAGAPHVVDRWLGIKPSLVSGLGMAALVLLALRGAVPSSAAAGWVGRLSYPIFLLHVPVMQWVYGPLGMDGAAGFLASLALVVPPAWALHGLVEQPGIRLGRRLAGS